MDISGSRIIERLFALRRLGDGPGAVLEIGPGPKPKVCVEALRRGFDVTAVDLEEVRDEWMSYTLKGDRKFEWGWVKEKLPKGEGELLDIGPAPGDPKPARIASGRGWTVTAVGLEEPYRRMPDVRFRFILGDFNEVDAGGPFDWILNISTIEHFGLPGRYGIEKYDEDADLRGMAKARTLIKSEGRMILTVPVGRDAVLIPKHRVYGLGRLPRLLEGWQAVEQVFYAKFGGIDEYVRCEKKDAVKQEPLRNPSYYALGLFVLGAT